MKLITKNSELIADRFYWCRDKNIPNTIKLIKCYLDVSEPIKLLYMGTERIWAVDNNNQALTRWDIVGPVENVSEELFKSFIIPVKKWDVWIEGFDTTGQNDVAKYKGSFEGNTFKEACLAWVNTLSEEMKTYYSEESNSFWACKLFDNEIDARKSFG